MKKCEQNIVCSEMFGRGFERAVLWNGVEPSSNEINSSFGPWISRFRNFFVFESRCNWRRYVFIVQSTLASQGFSSEIRRTFWIGDESRELNEISVMREDISYGRGVFRAGRS